MQKENKNLGIAIVGLGGAVGTTAVAGSLLIRKGIQDKTGLPLAEFEDLNLTAYENIHFNGWDIFDDNLYESARKHGVLNTEELAAIKEELEAITPWKAIANKDFCSGVTDNKISEYTLRDQVKVIQDNLKSFAEEINAPVILIHLASTEHAVDVTDSIFQTVEAFEKALDDNSKKISPAMVYAYAAIDMGVAYGNFTPSMGVDVPALIHFAQEKKCARGRKRWQNRTNFCKNSGCPCTSGPRAKSGWLVFY